jgi:putative multiple sugar transport system substrate-binding protein
MQDKGPSAIAMPTKSSARWIADGDNMVKVQGARLQDRPSVRRRRHPEPARADREHGDQGRQGAGDRLDRRHDPVRRAAAGRRQGIKVIAYDRLIRDTPNVDYYATFDNFQVGVLQAGYIVKALKA